jgi:hypothetical protein
MKFKGLVMAAVLASGLLLPVWSRAQSEGDGPSLGEIARQLRHKKQAAAAPEQPVIDNDNLPQIMQEVESNRARTGMAFSFDNISKNFQVSPSPDVTCSLSFNGNNTSLLTPLYAPQSLPEQELPRLDGPASIEGDALQVMMHNGTWWDVTEITIGFTLVRKKNDETASVGAARLVPAAQDATPAPQTKRSDVTVLYHLKGSAMPFTSTLFRAPLGFQVGSDQEWHWAIVEAKGIPPRPAGAEQAGN